jgi:hypothetical protein
MLAIDTASTYPEIQLLYSTGLMTPGKIYYKVYQLAMIDPCMADFQRISCAPLKRLILMTYHEGDITLVTLGSVLACFFV